MPLLRRLAKPFNRLCLVLRNAFAFEIARAKNTLRLRISLNRRLAKPLNRFSFVLRNAFAVIVAYTQIVLRCGITVLCLFLGLCRR